jgi:hypothetical protein
VLSANGGDGNQGVVLNGGSANDRAGRSVAGLGDVNGDGADDLIVGAYFADPVGTDRGQAYVVFGRGGNNFMAELDLTSLNGSTGFALNGAADNDRAGQSVAGLGDVNCDGFADLLVGASRADVAGHTDCGQAYVVYGRSTGFAASLDLSSINGSNGFTLNGGSGNDQAGIAAAGLGDVNGDGVDDLLVGAPNADAGSTDRGQAYVVFGRTPHILAVGPDKGSAPLVKVFTANGVLVANIQPYPLFFTGWLFACGSGRHQRRRPGEPRRRRTLRGRQRQQQHARPRARPDRVSMKRSVALVFLANRSKEGTRTRCETW